MADRARERRAAALLKPLALSLIASLACPASLEAKSRAIARGEPLALRLAPGHIKPAAAPTWLTGELAATLGLTGADSIEATRAPVRVGAFTLLRGAQFHNGRRVLGRDIIVAVAHDGETHITGRAAALGEAPAAPAISPHRAAEIAGLSIDPPRTLPLRYYPVADRSARLVYEVRHHGPKLPLPSAAIIYIDAVSGAEVARLPLLHTALDREVISFGALCRRLNITSLLSDEDSDALFGAALLDGPRRREGGSRFGETGVDRLYDHLGAMHTFLESTFGLDSLDDEGLTLRALAGVRFSADSDGPQCVGNRFNAAWLAPLDLMIFPDTALNLPEVVGHEMAHGLIDHGSELVYTGESGALNESIADLIGVSFRAWLAGGGAAGRPAPRLAVSDALWALREDGGIMRDMARPRRAGRYPDHFDDYVPETAGNPTMHSNSSIINQAWYLMAEGGPHPRLGGVAVDGIGLEKTVRIAVLSARRTLGSWADFSDARVAFALAAEVLHGRDSREWRAVHQALDAVGVPGVWRSAATTPADSTRAPDSPPQAAPAAEPAKAASDVHRVRLVLMLGALAVVLLLIYRGRTALSDGDRADSARPAAAREPISPQRPANLSGYLQALDRSEPIPLQNALLQTRDGLVIGRAAELAHVCMENRRVSRRHLRVFATDGRLFIEDMNSTHGTRLNGQRLPAFTPRPITAGDVIHVADFAYELTGEAI